MNDDPLYAQVVSTVSVPIGQEVDPANRTLLLPSNGPCPGGLMDEPPAETHDWTMPLYCMPHDYEHLAGLGCWRCGAQAFYSVPFCPNGWEDWQ